jgi:transposase
MTDIDAIAKRYRILCPAMDERLRRLWVGAECSVLGFGGIATLSKATGLSRNTIARGIRELKTVAYREDKRIRRGGGGRKRAVDHAPELKEELLKLVEPTTGGDPESPLRWTCKSLRKIALELKGRGYQISYRVVGEILKDLGYSLQGNRKTLTGSHHRDRDAQFRHINTQVLEFQKDHQPVISVDTKKPERVGRFKNAGREWHPKKCPEEVLVYDFPSQGIGKAIPYGVYDLTHNLGWVSVGIDHDTAELAVETIRRWWWSMGQKSYPEACRLLITADGGGSNGSRVKLWKTELQQLANETGLTLSVCHFPPGTSKWNKIEHRLFSYITENWRGKPLVSYGVIVNLIAGTTTTTGLKVKCELNSNKYPIGIEVSDREMAEVHIKKDDFHGNWNYTISPNK